MLKRNSTAYLIPALLILTFTLFSLAGCSLIRGSQYEEDERFTVRVTIEGGAGGYVRGVGKYKSGETATLIATAEEGYAFKCWGDGSTSDTISITVFSDIDLFVIFEKLPPPPRTKISSISTALDIIWGADESVLLGRDYRITFDNGDVETVPASELVFTGFSAEEVGGRSMTVVYGDFSHELSYYVYYSSLDAGGVTYKSYYLLGEELEISGAVTARGLGGRERVFVIGEDNVGISGFEGEESQLGSGRLVLSVPYSKENISLAYSVWYMPEGVTLSDSLAPGDIDWEYRVYDFAIHGGYFSMTLEVWGQRSGSLRRTLFDSGDYEELTWKDYGSDSVISLYHKDELIGRFDYKTNKLTIYEDVFNKSYVLWNENYANADAVFYLE